MKKRPVVIGICGGTGSGKTTVAREILKALPSKNVSIIHQDAYYKKQSEKSFDERTQTNYDHPFAFDTDLLLTHIGDLIEGEDVDMPIYDFSNHDRCDETERIYSREIVILEGILILEDPRLREVMDIKIFVDTDTDVRIIRRITRDINERGRSLESVIEQYLATVKPAHEQFIEPSKKYADIIIPEGGFNAVAIDVMVGKIKTILD
jgi:uridine kinase